MTNKHPLESVAEALDNAAQVFSNLHRAYPDNPDAWEFHLNLTFQAITILREHIAADLEFKNQENIKHKEVCAAGNKNKNPLESVAEALESAQQRLEIIKEYSLEYDIEDDIRIYKKAIATVREYMAETPAVSEITENVLQEADVGEIELNPIEKEILSTALRKYVKNVTKAEQDDPAKDTEFVEGLAEALERNEFSAEAFEIYRKAARIQLKRQEGV
jgi:hypothetical protein